MLFIWTSEGGPLQYVGMVLFLLQFLLPPLLQTFMLTTTSPPPEQTAGAASGFQHPIDNNSNRHHHHQSHDQQQQQQQQHEQQQAGLGFLGYCVIFCFVLKLLLGAYWWWWCRHHYHSPIAPGGAPNNTMQPEQQQQQQEGAPQQQRQQQEQEEENGPPPPVEPATTTTSILRQRWNQFWLQLRRNNNYIILLSLLGFPILGCCVMIIVSTIGFASFSTEVLRLLPWLGQLVTILSILSTTTNGRGGGGAAGFGGANDEQLLKAKMEKMTRLVHNIPIEPFVSQNDLIDNNSKTISISQLKKMLERRGINTNDASHKFVERQDLIDALLETRKYSGDSCCICFEDFTDGEPLRVLPKCHHEIHLECFDKWVYTFANNPIKLKQHPTCPLVEITNEGKKNK